MLKNLSSLPCDWELIAVDDGSLDSSKALLSEVFAGETRARIISYPVNRGRGHALRTGIDSATGDIIVTTEIDLSWGDAVVEDLVYALQERPDLDAIIASPNLPGGGYVNVPARRVLISRLGNLLIRLLFTKKVTMNTGMTRAYRRAVIQDIQTDEKGKEFHLEVLLKLLTLGYRVGEIPATLEWKEHKLSSPGAKKRKSSSRVAPLIVSHLNFAVFANPIRYFWSLSALCFLGSIACILDAAYRMFVGEVAIYVAIVGLFLGLFGLMFFGFGVTSAQNIKILRELWRKR